MFPSRFVSFHPFSFQRQLYCTELLSEDSLASISHVFTVLAYIFFLQYTEGAIIWMSGFTAINQSLESATNFQKAKDIHGSDSSLSRVTARQRAGVVSSKSQRHAKNRVISNSSLYTGSFQTLCSTLSTHRWCSDVHRDIATNDPSCAPGPPASHQTGGGSQNKAPVNAAQQSPISAVELQQDRYSETRSQTANPRKRRNHVEKGQAHERLQPPHKKLKHRRTVAREETTTVSCSMEVSK